MPQPNFVPVRFRESRITQSKGVDGGSSTVTGLPLTVNEIKERLLPCKILCEGLGLSKRECAVAKTRALARKDYLPKPNSGQPAQNLKISELVEPVERRDFVGFGQSRIVEHRIAEIFDGAAVIHHGLPDVNNFGGPLADNCTTSHLRVFRTKKNFKNPLLSPS